ncbi:MAG TPA: hypothetical protein VFP84_30945 [Kofleriaceae bacterium]|nr:hypothetical protein [Kofleriaceae bacterium]
MRRPLRETCVTVRPTGGDRVGRPGGLLDGARGSGMAKRPATAPRRPHWTEADARRVLADWERSGETLEAFARGHGLGLQRLAWWKKRRCAARPEPRSAVTFIPAAVIHAVPAPTVTPGAVIRLATGS